MVSCWLLAFASTAIAVATASTPLTRVAFGSCNDQAKKQPLWPAIVARKPELWVWLGDNIYGDYRIVNASSFVPPFPFFRDAPPEMLAAKYRKQLAHPEYAKFRASTPIIGTWDDHDYGRNDGNKQYPFRKESQTLFLDFIQEPAQSPRRQQEGVYASHTYGEGAQAVKFILLDVRYHKDPYGTPNGDFLGRAQWAWLEHELATSTAAFNVIGSGVQVVPDDRWYGGENWARFPAVRLRLLDLLLRSSAKGIVLISGDVHFAEINQVVCGDARITEVTSSGMTHAWQQYVGVRAKLLPAWIFTLGNIFLPWHYRVDPWRFFAGLNFADIEFDWAASPPVATFRVRDVHGAAKLEQRVVSAPMPAGASAAATCTAPHEVHPVMYALQKLALSATVVSLVLCVPINVILALIVLKRILVRFVFGPEKPAPIKTAKLH
ncbi:hypothetical protein ACHHYP_20361 [Achlya hypogyna]|uniref:PhoD-like phosphatase metallophosphatase domain-containing protein n=1 Tax=Achlya hypogyna TaxID=1202772 RepID=A0A1V9ZKR9_ACHHY|nr:hypothetical protein ACHHYP_20361 [Achlya hypogyna]